MIDVTKAAMENCEYNEDSLRQFDSKFVETFKNGVLFAMRWIPVDDLLPDDFTSVLVRDNSASPIRSVALFQDGKFYPDFKAIQHENITHWRPLDFVI